jgi:hypothetical protein
MTVFLERGEYGTGLCFFVCFQSYSLGIFTGKGGPETWREEVDDHHYREPEWTPTKKNIERKSWNIYHTFQYD